MLIKLRVLPAKSAAVLSKLENNVFIPALVAGTFVENFTVERISETAYICAVCSLAMPLGLNTIVIPSAQGKDTTVAAGMAVISYLLSVVTIPIVFSFSK